MAEKKMAEKKIKERKKAPPSKNAKKKDFKLTLSTIEIFFAVSGFFSKAYKTLQMQIQKITRSASAQGQKITRHPLFVAQKSNIKKTKLYKWFMTQKFSMRVSIVITLVFILWIFSGQISLPKQEQTAVLEEEIFQVRVFESVAAKETLFLELSGETFDSRHVTLKAEISRRVVEVNRRKGDVVMEGDAILSLNSLNLPEELARAEAELDLRRLEFESAKNLADQGLRSRTRLIEAEINFYSAQSRLKQVQHDLKNAVIRAPFAGVLSNVDAEIGDFLSVGTPVAIVNDLDPLIVRASVSEKDIDRINYGDIATGLLTNGQTFEGIVTFIALSNSNRTRTFEIEVEVDNVETVLRKGLSAKLRVNIGDVFAHRLPSSTLSLNDEGVLGVKSIDDNDTVVFRPITVIQNEIKGILVSGLDEGVRVISVGQEFVSAGQKVIPVPDQRFSKREIE